ncbi:hypothetical protein DY000_02002828 [Brassica cretica]|uniref:Uncharacterized protein n=1 Tax=Brassica cretica TaxID=69181 RepID=A0ABQ7CBH2_BRACR|nr:hypothetical protein DY000_02002828 [Brassica cretica]
MTTSQRQYGIFLISHFSTCLEHPKRGPPAKNRPVKELTASTTVHLRRSTTYHTSTIDCTSVVMDSCPPDQLQPQGVPDPRRTELHPTSRTTRDLTATAPVRIRAARDPIEAAHVPASSRLDRV